MMRSTDGKVMSIKMVMKLTTILMLTNSVNIKMPQVPFDQDQHLILNTAVNGGTFGMQVVPIPMVF